MQLELFAITSQDYEKLKEYCMALEATRRDLIGVNEELREKILALERGQEVLINKNNVAQHS